MKVSPRAPRRGGFFAVLAEALTNAVCTLIISYCILSFFAGQAGVIAYRDLKATIQGMESKVGELEAAEIRLKQAKEALSKPGDWITREARAIGYLKPGEKIIILPQELRAGSEGRQASDGEILRVGQSTGLPDSLVKILSALIAAAVWLASMLMAAFPSRKELRRHGHETEARNAAKTDAGPVATSAAQSGRA